MDKLILKFASSKPVTIGAVVLYGVIEFVALRRSTVLAQPQG
ncbi:hypothetical protein [Hydrocarboniphaga sp.]